MSPEFLFFLAVALVGVALSMRLDAHEEARRDARKRNPERTWDDER